MANIAHVNVGTTPVDLTEGLTGTNYLAQPRRFPGEYGVLYAIAATAPAHLDDWFYADGGEWFRFARRGLPVWARKHPDDGTTRTVAVALAEA